LLVLVHLRKGETFAEAGAGFGVSTSTAWRYVEEVVALRADRPYYSGKRRAHGMNVQVIATPGGTILWTSGALPGSTHDLTAARIWGILRELEQAGILTLADKGYQGAATAMVITPYKGRNKPESQKQANRSHAKLRGPGERANAQIKTWNLLRKLPAPARPATSSRPSPSCRTTRSPEDERGSVNERGTGLRSR
jgi:hypothetical protein